MRLPIIRFLISYQGPDYRQAPMRTLQPIFLAAVATVVTLVALPASAQAQQQKPNAALAVSTTSPRAEQFARTVVATGSVYAWQEAVIGSEVGGYRVAAVNVDVGDKVRKGQELVRLAGEMLTAEV